MALTAKGEATRRRIVESAAELVLERGVGGTSLEDIRVGTSTSSSQLFHYFPGGKTELVGAIAAFQNDRVTAAQRPWLDHLDSWDAWEGWRAAVVAHYGSQRHWGCPIGALSTEVAYGDPALAAELAGHMAAWRAHLEDGVRRMADAGLLRADADPHRLALTIWTALQGGLLLLGPERSTEPLELALDSALAALRSARATSASSPA